MTSFEERIIILNDGPQQLQVQEQPGAAGILQLVANTNFPIDDSRDYSTTTHFHSLSFGEPMLPDFKTYTIDMQTFLNHTDIHRFRYIKVEYTGQPDTSLLREMFVDWLINNRVRGLITYQDMSIFRKQRDYMKIYANLDGNGGVIVYNLYSDVVFPNGLLKYIFTFLGPTPIYFNFKEVPNMTINNITLTSTYKFIPESIGSYESEHVRTYVTVSPKWAYFSTNSVNVPHPDRSNVTNHRVDATGNVHGVFIKAEYVEQSESRMISLKITLNGQIYVNYTNIVDVQMNTIQLDDCDWIFVPFDLERRYSTLADCFVADHNGGLELGRIDTIRIQIVHEHEVKAISYAFPAFMSVNRQLITPELLVDDSNRMMNGYSLQWVDAKRAPASCLADFLSNIDADTLTPLTIEEECIISREPIQDGMVYVVCSTCTKPIVLEFAIGWLKSPNANNQCPHCRVKWREIRAYKQRI